MNYRHAFHAGGFADVIKHIVLVRMLSYLHEQGPAVPRLRGDRPPRLPARPGDDAADAGRVSDAVIPRNDGGLLSSPDVVTPLA